MVVRFEHFKREHRVDIEAYAVAAYGSVLLENRRAELPKRIGSEDFKQSPVFIGIPMNILKDLDREGLRCS